MYDEEGVYLLPCGSDVDGIVDDGITEHDKPDTAFQIVSTAPTFFTPLTHDLDAQTRTRRTGRSKK